MKDDFNIPNIGQAPPKYDSGYLNRVVRNVEMIFTTLRAKGKAMFTDIVADTITTDELTTDHFIFETGFTDGGYINFQRQSVPGAYLQVGENSTGGYLRNFSDVANAKIIVYDSTTVVANTAPSAGALGHYFRILGANRFYITDTDVNFSVGAKWGAVVVATPTDLSRHIELHTANYGFSVTTNTLNSVVGNSGSFAWLDAGGERMRLNTLDQLSVSQLRLTSTADASTTSTDHGFQIGADNVANLIADGNEIMARNNGAAAVLTINAQGGDVNFGAAGLADNLGLLHGHLSFPAVQNPSTGVNVLDDYEEGTWTAGLTYATPGDQNFVISTNACRYVKVGKMVTIWATISTTTHTFTTATGGLSITGIPFLSATVSAMGWIGEAEHQGVTYGAGRTQLSAEVLSNSQSVRLIMSGSAVTRQVVVATTNTTSGTQFNFLFSISYEAST